MKSAIKNIFLVVAISAVLLMVMAILLYDYIPNSITVAEPNIYETDSKTAKVLAQIADESSENGTGTGTKSNVVLKSYSISQTDLALYQATNSYDPGKADPFADAVVSTGENTSSTTNGGSSSNSNSSSSSSNSGTSNDGTLFGSTSNK